MSRVVSAACSAASVPHLFTGQLLSLIMLSLQEPGMVGDVFVVEVLAAEICAANCWPKPQRPHSKIQRPQTTAAHFIISRITTHTQKTCGEKNREGSLALSAAYSVVRSVGLDARGPCLGEVKCCSPIRRLPSKKTTRENGVCEIETTRQKFRVKKR